MDWTPLPSCGVPGNLSGSLCSCTVTDQRWRDDCRSLSGRIERDADACGQPAGLSGRHGRAHAHAHGVLSENSIEPKSSRMAMIEVELASKPCASADGASGVIRGRHERRAQESIADASVVAFQTVVPNVLGDDESEMPARQAGRGG